MNWNDQLGGRYAGAGIKAMAHRLHNDEEGINAVCNIMLRCEDIVKSRNAAWVLNNLPQSDKMIYLMSHYDELVSLAVLPNLPFRRGLVLSLLLDMQTSDNYRGDLFDFCLLHLGDKRECDSSRACMIHLAAEICIFYPELSVELISCLDLLADELTPSVASARNNALRKLGVR